MYPPSSQRAQSVHRDNSLGKIRTGAGDEGAIHSEHPCTEK
jgi:hypothetical protein